MLKPSTSKQKDVKGKQTVMGNFFSKSDKSKKATTSVEKSETGRTGLKRKVTGAGMFGYSWTRGAHRDTEVYRNGYPGKEDYPDLEDNYLFYMNKIPSKPDGDYIDKIHANWWGDYRRLEIHHGYIQWLFPIRESGLNMHAQELQLHEIEKLKKNKTARKRVLTSYKMMLDFYGMELLNEKDGIIGRADNWRDRFQHLNRSYHNYLRITRILKCLGEFDYEYLKMNFVKFVLEEGLVKQNLNNLIDSCVKFWIGVLRDDQQRKQVFDYYEELSTQGCVRTKRRVKSPSPPYVNKNSKTGKRTISKPKQEKSPQTSKNEVDEEPEFSDDNDDALFYAMSLIDEDKPQSRDSYGKNKGKKDHEISDSDDDNNDESQEMDYWKNETESTEDYLNNDYDKTYDDSADDNDSNVTDNDENSKSNSISAKSSKKEEEIQSGSDFIDDDDYSNHLGDNVQNDAENNGEQVDKKVNVESELETIGELESKVENETERKDKPVVETKGQPTNEKENNADNIDNNDESKENVKTERKSELDVKIKGKHADEKENNADNIDDNDESQENVETEMKNEPANDKCNDTRDSVVNDADIADKTAQDESDNDKNEPVSI
ncbi:hypothetical protein ACF0H5_015632 [Mactra antiquata]